MNDLVAVEVEAEKADKLEGKKAAYFFHSYGRAKSRYDLVLGKQEQARICKAISEGDEYIPCELIKDWGGSRQMYLVEYMGTKLRLIYDSVLNSIVTFLPLVDNRPEFKCKDCKDKGWFTKRKPTYIFKICKCGRGRTLNGYFATAKLEAFKAGLKRSQSLNGIVLEDLLQRAAK